MTENVALRAALKLPLDVSLKTLSSLLWQYNIPHRITEEQGKQVLWVGSDAHSQQVQTLYRQWREGELTPTDTVNLRTVSRGRSRRHLLHTPMVLVLLLLSVAGAGLVTLDRQFQWIPLLSFYQFEIVGNQLQGSWPTGEYWRLVTPIFLHFGLLHIAFNGLWLWELGGMIEQRRGPWHLLGVVLLVATGSNLAQAMVSQSLFGGMSGVIYGLLGYIIVWNRLRPDQAFPLTPGIAVVMLLWLVLCFVGFAKLLGIGDIANTAHLSGLILGLILGGFSALTSRRAPPAL